MDDIFVSWASPDKPIVDRIVDQLLDAALPVNEYSRGMRTGENIREWINEGIRNAKVVLAVASAESLTNHRDWLDIEFTLALARLDDPSNRLKTFALVRLGEVPDKLLPRKLPWKRASFLDLEPGDPGREERLIAKLVADLSATLGISARQVIPAALFAMTSDEFTQFRTGEKDQNKLARLAALCRSVGMPPPPELWDELGKRYGRTASDFAPYGDGRPLIEVARNVLRDANQQRLEQGGDEPLHLRWYSRAELTRDPADERSNLRRRKWEAGYSVLIVDAVSALHGDIAQSLEEMPSPDIVSNRAVICIPPYTRHTGVLENLIAQSLQTHTRLSDAVFKWRNLTALPSLAFDIPTETSLKRWLSQLLFRLDTNPQPLLQHVKAMSNGEHHESPAFRGVPGGFGP